MRNSEATFHLPWRRRITILIIVMWLPIIFTFNELLSALALIMLINISLPIIGIWYVFTVTVNSSGIVLNKVNKLLWSDVISARKVKVLGLNHIRIKRKQGMPWLLPLFFIGENKIEIALLNNAPVNNPLYKVASELQNR